jgi:hypothetical protein
MFVDFVTVGVVVPIDAFPHALLASEQGHVRAQIESHGA